ncbi:hypothetical protein MPSEU_000770000 [Mayamaea pseudoterrestris]|nr:hypothetical protein MPSEU_000770000 [Mayamaea pseudoterrestris]
MENESMTHLSPLSSPMDSPMPQSPEASVSSSESSVSSSLFGVQSPPSFFAYLRTQQTIGTPNRNASHQLDSPLLQSRDDEDLDVSHSRSRFKGCTMSPWRAAIVITAFTLLSGLILLHDNPSLLTNNGNQSVTERLDLWSDPLLVVLQANPIENATSKDIYSLLDPSTPALAQARTFTIGLQDLLMNATTRSDGNNDYDIRVDSYYSLQEQDLHWLAPPLASFDGSVSTIAIRVKRKLQFASDTSNTNETNVNTTITTAAAAAAATNTTTRVMRELARVVQTYSADFEQAQGSLMYFTIHLTGWNYMMEINENNLLADLVKMTFAGLVLTMLAAVIIYMNRHERSKRFVKLWQGRRGPVFSILAGWTMTMTLWCSIMMFSRQIVHAEDPVETERITSVLVPSLAFIASIHAAVLYNDSDHSMPIAEETLEKRNYHEFHAWAATSGLVCLGSLCIARAYAACMSVAMLLSASIVVHSKLLPRFKRVIRLQSKEEEEHDYGAFPTSPSSSSSQRSSLIRTTSEFYAHANIDEEDDDDEHVDLELSSPIQPLSPGYYLERQVSLATPESMWFVITKNILLHPCRGMLVIIILLLVAGVSLSRSFMHLHATISLDSLLSSRRNNAFLTWNVVRDKLQRPGHVAPYRLVFDGHAANMSMTASVQAFEVMHIVVEELMATEEQQMEDHSLEHDGWRSQGATHIGMTANEARQLAQHIKAVIRGEEEEEEACSDTEKIAVRNLGATDVAALSPTVSSQHHYVHHRRALYNGIAVMHNTRLPHSVYSTAKFCNKVKPKCPFELLHAINVLDEWYTSNDTLSTTVNVELGVDPFSEDGIEWFESTCTTIRRLKASGVLRGVEVQLLGPAVDEHHGMSVQRAAMFPTMYGVMTILMVATFICHQSMFAALLNVACVAFTLYVSFGVWGLLFQPAGSTLNWRILLLAPILIVSISVGNNSLLLSRVVQLRTRGFEHKSAVAAGLFELRNGLMTVGLAIAVVFASQALISSSPILRTCLFLVAIASLVDAILVQFMIVPITMNLVGPSVCWWPRNFRPSTRFEGFETDEHDDLSEVMRNFEASSELNLRDVMH